MLKITIVAIGNKMPGWVMQASQEFAKRLQEYYSVTIVEIPLLRRGKSSDIGRLMDKEMLLMTAAIPNNARIIALNSTGHHFTSEQLAVKIERIQMVTSHLCFLIGGPEGLSSTILARADEQWSLSKLTLPHPLVRIVFLEAIYRAGSIIHNHPYHK